MANGFANDCSPGVGDAGFGFADVIDNLKGMFLWSTSVDRVPIILATALQAFGACWLLLILFYVSYSLIIISL